MTAARVLMLLPRTLRGGSITRRAVTHEPRSRGGQRRRESRHGWTSRLGDAYLRALLSGL
jgi:hypothetical protein